MVLALIFLFFSFFIEADSRKKAIIAAAIPLHPILDKIVEILQSQTKSGIRINSEIMIVQIYILVLMP